MILHLIRCACGENHAVHPHVAAEIADRADAEKHLLADISELLEVERAAKAVVETAHELELPAPDGLGWFPIVCKDKYIDALRAALARTDK